jgi:hypothetical protein
LLSLSASERDNNVPLGVQNVGVTRGEQLGRPGRGLRVALATVAWFNLVSALVGMVGLTVFGGMGIPLEWLRGSLFDSYLWPGVILGAVVGGVQALALVAQYRRYRLAWGMHAAAGLVMMIWIFVEIAIMLVWSPLHGIYFATGLLQTVLAVLALGAWPRPFLARAQPSPRQR